MLTGEDTQLGTCQRHARAHHLSEEHHVVGIEMVVDGREGGRRKGEGGRCMVGTTCRRCRRIGKLAVAFCVVVELVALARHECGERSAPLIIVEVGHAALSLDDVIVDRLQSG